MTTEQCSKLAPIFAYGFIGFLIFSVLWGLGRIVTGW